jgi:hypothetical protein
MVNCTSDSFTVSFNMIYFTDMSNRTFPHFQGLIERQLEKRQLVQQDVANAMGFSQPMVSTYSKYPEKLKRKGVDYAMDFFKAAGFYEAEARDLVRELFLEDFYKLYGDVQELKKFAYKPKYGSI